MKFTIGLSLALVMLAGSSAFAASPRNKFTRDMMKDTIQALRENSLCEGLDETIKKVTLDAEAQLDLPAGTVAPEAKPDKQGQTVIEACHETLNYLAYIQRASSGNLIRYGLSVQVGFELNAGKNIWPAARIFGPSIGVSGSKGILSMWGDRMTTHAVSTLGFVPFSIGKGKTLPIEPMVQIVAYYATEGVPSLADVAGDYVKVGSDFPNPFSSALKVRSNTDFEIMHNTHSPVWAITVPFVSPKFSGAESRGSDLHAGITRLYVTNPATEGQVPGTDETLYPSVWRDLKDLYHSTELDSLVSSLVRSTKSAVGMGPSQGMNNDK
jgi:hypothetical protein